MEDRRGKDDEVSRQVWEKVEDRKTNKTRIEETGGERKEEDKTKNRRGSSNSKNSGRKKREVR